MIVGLIVLGGGLGAVARWSITALLGVSDKGFPVGTAFWQKRFLEEEVAAPS